MNKRSEVEGICLTQSDCVGLGESGQAKSLIKAIRDVGGKFVRGKMMRWIPDNDPERYVNEKGSILVAAHVEHAVLGRGILEVKTPGAPGVASLQFGAEDSCVDVSQTIAVDNSNLEEVPQGLVEFAKVVYSVLRPAYAWVDVASEKALGKRFERFSQIKYWFYANLFSPRMRRGAPEGFFEKVPLTRRIELDDGGLLLVSKRSFADWAAAPPPAVVDYLAEHAPKIKVFRQ